VTREGQHRDLRQFTASCRTRHLRLFAVRRADIEALGTERRHRTLGVARKGGKKAVIPSPELPTPST